ncbi:hypothetical protein [Corallococcus sp. EGB]|uniref:hypothetical protein n=1 Tax=Corallococcus sp. EGB TaxID=1521117 RepID=UPI001CBD20C1|nr:hypothetical protein [Corallococcus sp. EGB]
MSFDLDPAAEPGRGDAMTHFGFAEFLVPRWADVKEPRPSLVGLDGAKLAAREDGTRFIVARPTRNCSANSSYVLPLSSRTLRMRRRKSSEIGRVIPRAAHAHRIGSAEPRGQARRELMLKQDA